MSSDQLEKAPDAYRTISEVAEDLDVPQHVLRFWETRFSQIRPLKRGGGRRYYRPDDVALIKGIRALLYGQGYTIRGVQRILKDHGLKHVQALARGEATAVPARDNAPAAAQPAPEPDIDAVEEVEDIEVDAEPVDAPAPQPRQPMISSELRLRLETALGELSACRRMINAARETG